MFHVGFNFLFGVGAVFFSRIFGDFRCSNFAQMFISLLSVLCCIALYKTSSENQFLNVFHVGFNSFAPEILVFSCGFDCFLGSQSPNESCFIWNLTALLKNPRVSCGF